ncbi:MAG: hypothetical protein M0024_13825, partial [Nitrospiraceae bacterium]|nr:hypothetical protein [Nitrospiraceae bacterium]
MKILIPFVAVIMLVVIAFAGVQIAGMQSLFGVWIPYAAVLIFVLGFVYRVIKWGRSPVPFSIPTTAGQMKS